MPPSIEKHWKAIRESGLLKKLRSILDEDLEEYLNCKSKQWEESGCNDIAMKEDADRQVEKAGPVYEQLRWIETTLSKIKSDLDMLEKKYTTLCQFPQVFTDNM